MSEIYIIAVSESLGTYCTSCLENFRPRRPGSCPRGPQGNDACCVVHVLVHYHDIWTLFGQSSDKCFILICASAFPALVPEICFEKLKTSYWKENFVGVRNLDVFWSCLPKLRFSHRVMHALPRNKCQLNVLPDHRLLFPVRNRRAEKRILWLGEVRLV